MSISALVFSLLLTLGATALGEGFQEAFALLPLPSHSGLSDEILSYRLRQALAKETQKLRARNTGPVLAPSCLQSATYSDFFEIHDIKEPPSPQPPPPTLSLEHRYTSLSEVFDVLRSTEIGRAILKKFLPRYGFEIKIAPFDEAIASHRSDPSWAPSVRPAALYDAREKTIFIDEKREIGQIAFVLLHEIVHSLDGDFAKAFEREQEMRAHFQRELELLTQLTTKNPERSEGGADTELPTAALKRLATLRLEIEQFHDLRIFRAERFAYDASYQVWLELDFRYPGYYGQQSQGLGGKPMQYDDDRLVEILRLNPRTVAQYRKRECRTALNTSGN